MSNIKSKGYVAKKLPLCSIWSKKFLFKFQSNIYQAYEDRNFYERPNHGCEGLIRVNPKNSYCNSNGQLKIITGSSERYGRSLGIVATYFSHDKES